VSPILSAFVGFFICAVFPVFISFLISPEPLLRATSPVILFYLFVVFSAGKQLHNNLLNRIKLQKESAALNQQLELEKARAEQANQAKTRFISSMTHELKTPLNAIMGFSQLLALNEHLSEDDKDNVEQIDIASQQLLHLINNIFKLSDLVSDKRPITAAPVILDEVVSNVMPLVQTQANERDVTLSSQIADDPILADQSALEEVLFQLLSNAIQHSPLGGEVTLYSELCPNNKVRVTIQDTGEGIAEKYHADVFSAFNRLGKEAKTSAGMGTGLYFSKIHIEKMLGTIGFDSQEGEGSTFWFELNLAKAQPDD
jgi:signal transduction histidine kinase